MARRPRRSSFGRLRRVRRFQLPNVIVPPVPVPVLTLEGLLTFVAGAAAGTLVATIGNVPAGVTPNVAPGDGRLVLAGNEATGWKVVVGLSASSAGAINLTVSAPGALPALAVVTVSASAAIASISPSAAWQATAESAGGAPVQTGTANASDPVSGYMTTVACVGNFINPPAYNWPLVADEDLHVIAYAEGGIASVTFWCEGTTLAVASPTTRAITYGDRTENLSVYSARLKHDQFTQNGVCAVYATIKAVDPTIADRVLGPMLYRRKTTAQFYEIRIRPGSGSDVAGQVYYGPTALQKAHAWYRSTTANPNELDVWIWMDEEYVHDHPTAGTWTVGANRGNLLIKPKPGGSFLLCANSIATDQPGFPVVTLKTQALRLENVTIDMSRITSMNKDGARPVILINCTIKGAGRTERYGSVGRLTGALCDRLQRTQSPLVANSHMLYGCRITDSSAIGRSVTRSIFTTFDNIASDLHSPTTGNGALIVGLRATNHICSDIRTPIPHLALSYSGAGTPSYTVIGATAVGLPVTGQTVPRSLSLRVNGAEVQKIEADSAPGLGTGSFTFVDAAAAINAQTATTGFSATVLADYWRFALLNGNNSVGASGPVSTNPASPTSLTAWVDLHQDILQFGDTSSYDNVIELNTRIANTDGEAQQTFLKTTTGTARNCLIANNAFTAGDNEEYLSALRSQLLGSFSHVAIIHNSHPNQPLLSRETTTTYDAYCRIAGNVFYSLSTVSGNSGSAKVDNNHWIGGVTGSAPAPWTNGARADVKDNTSGGTIGELFNNWAPVGLQPKGDLLTALSPRYYPIDINGAARQATTPKGAVAA